MPSVPVRRRGWTPRCRSSGAESRGRQTTGCPSRADRHLRALLQRALQCPPHAGFAGHADRALGFLCLGTGTPPRQSTRRERTSTASGRCPRILATVSRMLSSMARLPLSESLETLSPMQSVPVPGRTAYSFTLLGQTAPSFGRVGAVGLDDCVGAGTDARCTLFPMTRHPMTQSYSNHGQDASRSSRYLTLQSRNFIIIHGAISRCHFTVRCHGYRAASVTPAHDKAYLCPT